VRRTKIVTTLGPATDDPKILAEMVRAGADVVRVNFSHGRYEDHAKRVELVRDAAAAAGKYVGVLGDLQGPKIRIERFVEGRVFLKEGDEFALDVSLDRKPVPRARWAARTRICRRTWRPAIRSCLTTATSRCR